jgi:hypothetical protein
VTTPGWEGVRSRVAALVARRNAVLEETAGAWVRFAREQGWSRHDVETLWEGLTEDLVRRYTRGEDRPGGRDVTRRDVLAVMGGLRDRITKALGS